VLGLFPVLYVVKVVRSIVRRTLYSAAPVIHRTLAMNILLCMRVKK
jgi:hypothetical protein